MIILDEKLAVLKQNLLAVLIVIFMLSFLFVNADLDSEILVNIKLSDSFYQVLPGGTITTETEIILLREVLLNARLDGFSSIRRRRKKTSSNRSRYS